MTRIVYGALAAWVAGCALLAAGAVPEASAGAPLQQVVVVRRSVPSLSPPLRDLVPLQARRSSGRRRVAALSSPAPNFEGIGQTANFSAYAARYLPPGPSGEAGPTQYVQSVNILFQVFDKTGASLLGPAKLSTTVFAGLAAPCGTSDFGDRLVQYDQLAGRWMFTEILYDIQASTYVQCMAVSQTGDATGSWYRYVFPWGTPASTDLGPPSVGVWPDGYYFATDTFDFSGNLSGSEVMVADRAQMLQGLAATAQVLGPSASYPSAALPSDLDGGTPPAAGTPNFYFSLDPPTSGAKKLHVWKLHVDWGTPGNMTYTSLSDLSPTDFTYLCPATQNCVAQAGTAVKVDEVGDRLMYRAPYRVLPGHDAVVLDHTVDANGGFGGVRWYELRGLAAGSPSIFQQGTYAPDVPGPDAKTRWLGSIAMDAAGNIALGFSESSNQINPRIRYTGRLAGATAGVMTEAEQAIVDGTASQSGSGENRWGNFSTMSVDASDDCMFWYTNEYYTAPGTSGVDWQTRIGAFRFSAPNECMATTAVEVSAFAARWTRAGVAVTWRARSSRVLGFDLFRNGRRLNSRLIPAGTANAAHRYLDRTAGRGVLSTYRLRVARIDGSRRWYGVGVVPSRS